MSSIFSEAQDLLEYSRRLRRDFHLHPELGFQEVRTAGIVAAELRQLGLEVTTGVGKTGVVAILKGTGPGPVVMLRFDMDALPIQEQTSAEYASQNAGVMHACGHDGHVAIGLTVARLLHQRRHQFKGTVKFIFQPAEEGMGGAESMIADDVLENPKPEVCFGVHVWNERPLGWAAVSSGPFMAGSEIFTIHLTGRGGHGALPHTTIDPVLASAQIISALQSIVSRNISPLQAAVVTVAVVKAGDAFNIIPHTAELRGTIRTFEPEVREKVIARFHEVVNGIAASTGCQASIEMQALTPAVINDPVVALKAAAALAVDLPDLKIETTFKSMVSEDMAYYLQKVPGVFFMIGSANPARGLAFGHHHPRFDFDEAALPIASAVVASAAIQALQQP